MNSVSDYLVKLYDMPPVSELIQELSEKGIIIKAAIGPEKSIVVNWVDERFGKLWASECDISFSHLPVACFVAISEEKLIGFCCYNASYRGFAGPLGVDDQFRRLGIGTALMRSCLHAMKHQGYAYAIMGSGKFHEYFIQQFNAILIENSSPGIYANRLK